MISGRKSWWELHDLLVPGWSWLASLALPEVTRACFHCVAAAEERVLSLRGRPICLDCKEVSDRLHNCCFPCAASSHACSVLHNAAPLVSALWSLMTPETLQMQ